LIKLTMNTSTPNFLREDSSGILVEYKLQESIDFK
jgi:hypothetical protein